MEAATSQALTSNASTVPAAFPVLMLMMPFIRTDNSNSSIGNLTTKTDPETIIPSGRALDSSEVNTLRALNFLPPGGLLGGRQPMRANIPWGMWFWAFQVGKQRPMGNGQGQGQGQQGMMPQLIQPPSAGIPMPLPGPFPSPQMPPFSPPQPQPQPPANLNPTFPFAPFFPPMVPPMPIPQPQPQPQPITEAPSTPSDETEPTPTQTPEPASPGSSSAAPAAPPTTVPTRFLFPNCGLTIPELMARTSGGSRGFAAEPVARRRNQLRIVGGRDTPIDAIPWQVSLQRPRNYEMRHYCGGSVIHPQFILTAAHCLDW